MCLFKNAFTNLIALPPKSSASLGNGRLKITFKDYIRLYPLKNLPIHMEMIGNETSIVSVTLKTCTNITKVYL